MRNNMIRMILLVACLLSLSLLTSCGGGGGGGGSKSPKDPGSSPSSSLQAPTNVTVTRETDGLKVSWSGVTGASGYRLERKDGEQAFVPVANSIPGTSCKDIGYPMDKTVQYAVRTLSQDQYSELSAPSDPISEWVQNIDATKMKFTDRVEVNWLPHPENPKEYIIYRKSKDVPTFSEVGRKKTNQFNDSSAVPGILYQYIVSWIDNSNDAERGKDVTSVYGLRYSKADNCEPNDDQDHAEEVGTSEASVLTYALPDPTGDIKTDQDWYVCKRDNTINQEIWVINVNLVTGSFDTELKLRFAGSNAVNTLHEGLNRIDCIFPAGIDHVYFKIEAELATSELGIGEYTIKVIK